MKHRTALITAGSLAGVVLAGAAAVAASLGILDASASSEVGNLSAATAVTQTVTEVSSPESVTYDVGDAGTVTITRTSGGIAVDEVNPAPGWSWTTRQVDANSVTVDLTGPSAAHRLTVTLDGERLIPVVTELTVSPTETAVSPTAVASSHDDDDEGEHDEHEEHEEYEGRDWDD